MTLSEAEYDHLVGRIEEMEAREADHLALRKELAAKIEHQSAEIARLRDLIRTARTSAEIGLERQSITHARLNLETVSRVLWEALHGGGG